MTSPHNSSLPDSASPGDSVIIFDGDCVMCSTTMRFFSRIDTDNKLTFLSRDSDPGVEFKTRVKDNNSGRESVIFVKNYKTGRELVWYASDASLMILREIGGVWTLISCLRFLPRFIREPVYNWIARNRYKLFGKHKHNKKLE